MTELHPFAPVIKTLGRGKKGSRSLSQSEAYDAMKMVLKKEATDLQLGAFLMLLRVKEETPEELAGFTQAARDIICQNFASSQPTSSNNRITFDWPNHAGKRKQYPWNLIAAKRLSEEGHRVLIHGSGNHTPNRMYTEAVFKAMGWPIARNPDEVAELCDKHNICYLPLRNIIPRLDDIVLMKPELGLRSPVNTICRLLNPLAAQYSLRGIFHPAYMPLNQQAAQLLGDKNMVVFKGEGGDTEIRPEAKTRIVGIKNGLCYETQLSAQQSERPEPEAELSMEAFKRYANQDTIAHEYGHKAEQATRNLALSMLKD